MGWCIGVTSYCDAAQVRQAVPHPVDTSPTLRTAGAGQIRCWYGYPPTVRAGRQQIAFGRERLIGVADWSNAQRNYDAIRVTLNSPYNSLDVFWFRPVLVEKYEFDDSDGRWRILLYMIGWVYDGSSPSLCPCRR